MNFGRVDREEGAGRTTNKFLIPSILLKLCAFMVFKDILLIILRSCRGTTLVKMNFGWTILDSYFFHPFFLSELSSQTPAIVNFGW